MNPKPEQLELFNRFREPVTRSNTRGEAAALILPTTSKARRQVLLYFADRGDRGATDQEVQRALGMRADSQRPRRRELVVLDFVTDSTHTRPTASGRQARVWRITPAGRAALRENSKRLFPRKYGRPESCGSFPWPLAVGRHGEQSRY